MAAFQAARRARPLARLLRLRNVPILEALRLEEALFRVDKRSWIITNEWDSGGGVSSLTGQERPASAATAIVLGISGKAPELVHLEKTRDAGIPLCRRFTGGGTVIVDTNTIFVTFLSAAGALPEVVPYPDPILQWTSQVYRDALQRCGIDSFATHANDYCIGDKKFGGNAQSISGKRWLHHTSLLWDYEPARMELLRMPARRPEYRADRSHGQFVRGLAASGVPERSQLMSALLGAVGERFNLQEVSVQEALPALAVEHRKTTRPVSIEDELIALKMSKGR